MSYAKGFIIRQGEVISIRCDTTKVAPIVKSALQMVTRDFRVVLSSQLKINKDTGIITTQIIPEFFGKKKEAFCLFASAKGQLHIMGSDAHGLAYGLLEISRLLGISPWEWWADAVPIRKSFFSLPEGYCNKQSPSVEFRGIFINDEDWGLMPWSSFTYEPWYKSGRIGPKTNERIFQLLLRLRANTYWPAMHECTMPFFLTPGNRQMAERYGIYIGGSHCEPMASSTPGEWSRRGKGDYDYVNNSENVYRFWEKRVKDVARQEILYTIGMRGIHDGAMNGAKTIEKQKTVLERVFVDQRNILRQYVNQDITKVPQVFIPYKEILDVYNAGLQVPRDVTLMWCDDNYGYIRHFPTAAERARKGGNGIYYHVSYWGRPHDYLWLGTSSPALLYQQMSLAYNKGIRKIWILNVGDIKPTEYQIELFLDMAWNMTSVRNIGVKGHLAQFLNREFGPVMGKELLPIMQEHYRLAFIRKPEFMGNTRVEEYNTSDYCTVHDLPWSMPKILQRLTSYQNISDKVEILSQVIPSKRADEYFQLVKYPIQAADEMNRKMLYAQIARHESLSSSYWRKSDEAYDSIVSLTHIYNIGLYNQGKWNRIMDMQPRQLPVFKKVDRLFIKAPVLISDFPLYHWNGRNYKKGKGIPCEGLGYEGNAVMVPKGQSIFFNFGSYEKDSVKIEVCLLPNHPINGSQLRFAIRLDKLPVQIISYETEGRNEEWKKNVLNNQAIRQIRFPINKLKTHHIVRFTSLDEGVILDQINIR